MNVPEEEGKNTEERRAARPKPGAEIEVVIESMAFGGSGVGRLGGLVCLVRGALPGERVRAMVTKRKKQHVEARVREILEPSPRRVAPPCAHFSICGGCAWQFMDYALQLECKERQVRDHLTHLAGIADPPVRPIIGAADPWRYRNKMEYAFSEFGDGRLKLGLHAAGRYDLVIDVDDCHLQPESCNALRNAARDEGRTRGWIPYHLRRHTGDMRHLVVRDASGGDSLMAVFATYNCAFDDAKEVAGKLAAQIPQLHSVLRHVNTSSGGGPAIAGACELLFGDERLRETVCGLTFEVSANAFMQTNTAQSERLYGALLDLCEFDGGETVFDLYTGAGTIALLASRRAAAVVGIESVPEAVADAKRNAEINGIINTEFVCAPVEDALGALCARRKPGIIIADPPRTGLHKNALRYIAEAAPPKFGYVSCNPATLARDAQLIMESGYTLIAAQPVDMFPHTHHIECVALFRKD